MSTVRRIERGTKPSSPLDVARRLIACVDVSMLVDADERPTATELDTARVAETTALSWDTYAVAQREHADLSS